MKNNSVIFSCIFLISFLLFHVLQAYSAERLTTSSTQSSAAVKADRTRLQSKISSVSKSIKLKENQRTKIQKRIFSFDKKIEKLGLKHHGLVNKQAEIQARLSGLEQEKRDLVVDIESSNRSMSQLIQAFYLLQTNTPTKALINMENLGDTSRMKVYHDYLIQEYLKQYQLLTKKNDAFATLDQTLSKKLTALEKLTEKNRRQSAILEESYQQRSKILGKLSAEIQSDKSKIKRLKTDQKRLEKLAKAIAKLELKSKLSKSSGMSFAKHKGELSWPVKGRVVKKFGRTRAGSRLKWRGILIETKAGASVAAVAAGRVVFSDWLSGYGFVLIVEHGRGYMSLYAHNQQLLSNVGDQVREKQQIALAGSSGRNGKPALYFEIRHKGKPVNPGKWILAQKSRK